MATSPADGTSAEGVAEVPQQLDKVLSGFGNYAVAMSTICILAGGITSFYVGFCSVGGASIGIGWPVGVAFAMVVAMTMGQVASAFPRAGGPYQWAAELGGNGWGWVAGCFNLAGLVTALAAVNMGLAQFALAATNRRLGYEPDDLSPWIFSSGAMVITIAQAAINHLGMRLTSKLTNFSGVLIVIVAILLTICMIVFPLLRGEFPDFGRLIAFPNYGGPRGKNVWPEIDNIAWLFMLGLLLPAYTLTGFDASAQTSEETVDPERNVPRSIVRAVLISGIAGWIMLAAVVLAAPDMDEAAKQGPGSFLHILRSVIEPNSTISAIRVGLYIGVEIAQFVCGLATLTAASRLAWALARDNGLPCSKSLQRIGTHQTPSVAIWSVCGVAAFFLLFVPYTAIAAVCATFLYIAYMVPTACGLLAYGHWPRTGTWHLGHWYRPLAAVCVAGCAVLIVIGMQPPNQIAVPIVGAMLIGLTALWFTVMRDRFRKTIPKALELEK